MDCIFNHLLPEAAAHGLSIVWLGGSPMKERIDAVGDASSLPAGLEAFAVIPVVPREGNQAPGQIRCQGVHFVV